MPPSHDADKLLRSLTRREREILVLIGQGHSMPEIARILGRSVRTVQAHRYSLGRKLAVRSNVSLVRKAIEFGLAPVEGGDGEQNAEQQRAQKAEEALAIIEAGIVAVADEDFLDHLVRYLARALDVKCALVAEMTGGESPEAIILAGWHEGKALPLERCPLATCPLAEQPPDRIHSISGGLAQSYPRCRLLQEAPLDFYLGVALRSSDGRHIATLAVMNDAPIDNELYPERLLRIFAGRTAAELDRRRIRQALRLSEARYRGVVEKGGNPVCRFAPDSRITFVNEPMVALLEAPREKLVGQKLTQFFSLADQQIVRRLIERLDPEDRSCAVTMKLPGVNNDAESRRWHIQALFSGDGTLAEFQAIVHRAE